MATGQDQHVGAVVPDDSRNGGSSMERAALRRFNAVGKILVVVIALLIFREIVSRLAGLLGAVPALISGTAALVVQLLCSRMAKAKLRYYSYMLLPTLLFTVLPAVLTIREMLNFQKSASSVRLWVIVPEFVGFVLPVFLLLIAYWVVGRPVSRKQEAGVEPIEQSRGHDGAVA